MFLICYLYTSKSTVKYTFSCFDKLFNVILIVSISLNLSVPKKGMSPFFGTDRIIKFPQMKSYFKDSSSNTSYALK